MLLDILFMTIGTAGLYFGADWLVDGASRLARAIGMSATAVGLTVVAFGTSMPEFVVGVFGGVREASDLILGNVVGSNILNIALILGVTAMIFPIPVQLRVVRRELPVMIGIVALSGLLALDGVVTGRDGLILLGLFPFYLWHVLREGAEDAEAEAQFEEVAEGEDRQPHEAIGRNVLLTCLGLVVLLGGAHLLVEGAVDLAERFGVSEAVIGLTVVAFGTSLPELATGLVAALKKQPDIAVGNIVGSNVFNVLVVLGTAALIHPATVEPGILGVDIPLMVLLCLMLLPIAARRLRVERWEGGVLVLGYLVFTWLLWVRF